MTTSSTRSKKLTIHPNNLITYLAKPGAEFPVNVHMRGLELNCETTNCSFIWQVLNSEGEKHTVIWTDPLAGTIPKKKYNLKNKNIE